MNARAWLLGSATMSTYTAWTRLQVTFDLIKGFSLPICALGMRVREITFRRWQLVQTTLARSKAGIYATFGW